MTTYYLTVLFVVLLLAVVFDVRERRIPNMLTLPAVAFGIIYWTCVNGLDGFMHGAEGLFLGIGFLIIFYLMGMMGAGDVKLMGAVGSILGPQGVYHAFLYSAVLGGLYAMFILARNKSLKQVVGRYGLMAKGYLATGQMLYLSPVEGKIQPLCYGVAISLGTVLSVLRPL